MSQAQKVIKYLAFALAIFIIFNIIGGIYWGISTFISFWDEEEEIQGEVNLYTLEVMNNNISSMDIDIATSRLEIKYGDSFDIQTNNKSIKLKEDGDYITIREAKNNFWKKHTSSLVITVPKDTRFSSVDIDTGAGEVKIEEILADKLEMDMGAGRVVIDSLVVSGNVSVDGGAGEFSILSGNIHNLEVDMGVGQFNLVSTLTGNSEIDAGVGDVNITLMGSRDNYQFDVDKGVGSITIDGENVRDEKQVGKGNNHLKLSGGVGSISVEFRENSSIFPGN